MKIVKKDIIESNSKEGLLFKLEEFESELKKDNKDSFATQYQHSMCGDGERVTEKYSCMVFWREEVVED